MPGCWYDQPDCLVPIAPRTAEEIAAAAKAIPPTGVLRITEDEFRAIRRLVGLGYRFAGRRIAVVSNYF